MSKQCRHCGMPVNSPRMLCPRCQLAREAPAAKAAAVATRGKLLETDAQVHALQRHICDTCVAIASSLDTLPRAMVPDAMRARWVRALGKATSAVALVQERLTAGPQVTR